MTTEPTAPATPASVPDDYYDDELDVWVGQAIKPGHVNLETENDVVVATPEQADALADALKAHAAAARERTHERAADRD